MRLWEAGGVRRAGAGVIGAATMVVGVGAGVLDDAFAAKELVTMGAPVHTLNSWDRHGAGPIQHTAGEIIRGMLGWF